MKLAVIGFGVMMGMTAQAGEVIDRYKTYDSPPYEVVGRDGAFEERLYGPHVLAEVRTNGGPRAAVGAGFRALAGYIFGKNETGEKIAMTSPVVQSPVGDQWVIRFMIPAGRDIDSLPAAKRADISFREDQGGRYLVYRFSGFGAPTKMQRAEDALRAYAFDRGHTEAGEVLWFYYDDPMTLPFLRRNEVALPIK